MSYNIDSIAKVEGGDLIIQTSIMEDFRRQYHDKAPENSLLKYENWLNARDLEGFLRTPLIQWNGEGSGSSFGALKEILAKTLGEADFIITWEGGDSHTGLRVRNGVVTEHEIVMALGKECQA